MKMTIAKFNIKIGGQYIHNAFELVRKANNAQIEVWIEPAVNGGFSSRQVLNGNELNTALLDKNLVNFRVYECCTPKRFRKPDKEHPWKLEAPKQKIVFRCLMKDDFYPQRVFQGFSGNNIKTSTKC